MRQLTEEEIKKGWIIHDKIKNHDFRKQPELYLLEEYENLVYKQLYELVCGWSVKDIVTNENGEKVYEYAFHNLEEETCNVSWSSTPQTISIDVWSNPNIALINDAIHDFNGIRWRLRSRWNSMGIDDPITQILLGKFIETVELMLMLFHSLLDGVEITEVKYPKDNSNKDSYVLYRYERNPRFNNNWTYPCFNKEGFYVNE